MLRIAARIVGTLFDFGSLLIGAAQGVREHLPRRRQDSAVRVSEDEFLANVELAAQVETFEAWAVQRSNVHRRVYMMIRQGGERGTTFEAIARQLRRERLTDRVDPELVRRIFEEFQAWHLDRRQVFNQRGDIVRWVGPKG